VQATRFTPSCNHGYQLCRDVYKFVGDAVAPVIDATRRDGSRPNPARDRAVECIFTRIVMWLGSVEKLDQTRDLQAIGAAARSIFEHYLDLEWLARSADPGDVERFLAFADVDRYWAASKVIRHKSETQNSKVDTSSYESFMRQADAGQESVPARVVRLWGADVSGAPRWPREHWSGVRNLRERARRLGPEFEDTYVQMYPILCALIHPGPTPLRGDLTWLEAQVGYGYFYAFHHAWRGTTLTIETLGLVEGIPQLEPFMRNLAEWIEESRQALPAFAKSNSPT
jgi:hypothetical protein